MTKKKTKLKWKVAEKPTGRYASFQYRPWPTASIGELMVAAITCEDDYRAWRVKTGNHAELTVRVMDRRNGGHQWRRLAQKSKTLDEAKKLAQLFWDTHPGFLGDE